MSKVIVYSKPNCPNCEHVKWGLDAQGVPYEVRMIEVPESATPKEKEKAARHKAAVVDAGFLTAPVSVFPNGKVMDGFHHGKFVDRMREMGYDV